MEVLSLIYLYRKATGASIEAHQRNLEPQICLEYDT